MTTSIVTGANRGIGLALVTALVESGHQVVAAVRKPNEAAALAPLVARGVVRVSELDVSDDESIAHFAEALGEEPVHRLFNNAGILVDEGRFFGEVPRADYLETFNVNVMGPVRLTNALRPCLRAGIRGGKAEAVVVNISSGAGSIADLGEPYAPAYHVSKAALNMATRVMAATLGQDGITCVALCPGWVRTDMGGPSATLSVEESASAIVKTVAGLGKADAGRFINRFGQDKIW